jgi:hypothetical protein
MADKAAVKDGDKIQYAREDAGGAIGWGKGNAKRGWRLTPGETITAGKDIPLDVCARLVEDGLCAVIPPPASTPQAATPAATPGAAGSATPAATPGAAGSATPANNVGAPAAAATGTTAAPAIPLNTAPSPTTPNTTVTPAAVVASPSASSSAVAASS